MRISMFVSGWDLTLNYLYHTVDEPVIALDRVSGQPRPSIFYARSHLVGASASNAFDDWTFRLETAFETDRYHGSDTHSRGVIRAHQFGSVLGLDYQGLTDQLCSFQWFQSSVQGQHTHLVKRSTEHTLTFLWEHTFWNDTLSLSLLQLYSPSRHDGLNRAKIKYNLRSNIDLSLQHDRFYGNQRGVYGQFDAADRITFSIEWGIN